MIFSYTDDIEIPELKDAETDLTENLQNNGATTPVRTQPYSPHSPLKDTLVALDDPPPRPCAEKREAGLQARRGYLPYVHLLVADNMNFRVY